MSLKVGFFDLDGLILDSEKIYFKFWKEAGMSLGYDLTDNDYLKLRSCDSELAKEFIAKKTDDENAYSRIRQLRKELMKKYLSNFCYELKEGVVEFLNDIADLPFKKVIVTSSRIEEKKNILYNLGVLKYFDLFIDVNDVKKGKPYPDIYKCAMAKIGVMPKDCIAFEDSPNGVESAFNAGITVIMIPDLSKPTKIDQKRAIIFDDIKKSLPFLQNLITE